MNRHESIEKIVFHALEALNDELPAGRKIPISSDTPLLGERSLLDSLSLVSVIVDVETRIEEQFDHAVSLTDDRALSEEVSPFSSVGALVSYLERLLNEHD